MGSVKRDRHLGIFPILIFFLFSSLGPPAWANSLKKKITARSAFLMDATTGQVLYERNPDLKLPPASTTKVVTAIIALESKKLHDRLKVTKNATRVPRLRMGLRPGHTMSVRDLLYGALLYSANDASMVLAEGIAGSVQSFAKMMTLKAHLIGGKNSRFTNPHGLTDKGHYSTTRDMAMIFNYAMRNPDFREIVQTKWTSAFAISAGKNKRVRRIPLRNKNRLLWNFDGAIGGKTGFTNAAQRCFVGAASRDGVTLIVSVLGSKNLWGDTRRLLEYGFKNYENSVVASSASPSTLSNGQVVTSQQKQSSPMFTWEEERTVKSSNGYIIQIASFREQHRAQSLKKQITEGGFYPFLEKGTLINGETIYRVRTGPYRQLTDAQKAARKIEGNSNLKVIILPVSDTAQPAETPG